MSTLPPLIIPVELQAREFDAKLLLSCIAAENGFPVILGSQTRIHRRIASLPRGIYVAKDIRRSKSRMISIMKLMGYKIVAWDEEGLVRYPAREFFDARIDPKNLHKIEMFFAWGPDDAQVLRTHPDVGELAIYQIGNPRMDILHPDLRFLLQKDADRIKDKYGRFILINTNFGTSNHFLAKYRIPTPEPAGEGGQDCWDDDINRYRNELFSRFLVMVSKIGKVLPDATFILRPHPSENIKVWKQAVAGCDNVHVVQEGSAMPWVLAAQALVHNGCTTAVEAFLLECPSVAYQPMTSVKFDRPLPNSISYKAADMDELERHLRPFVAGDSTKAHTAVQSEFFNHHVTRHDSQLASDQIIKILKQSGIVTEGIRPPGPFSYLQGWIKASIRAAEKSINAFIPGSKNSFKYERTRFAGISEDEVRTQIRCLSEHLGRFENITVRTLAKDIFTIEAGK